MSPINTYARSRPSHASCRARLHSSAQVASRRGGCTYGSRPCGSNATARLQRLKARLPRWTR
eukprot:15467962-Alexandrium_andersonii.AAC.1